MTHPILEGLGWLLLCLAVVALAEALPFAVWWYFLRPRPPVSTRRTRVHEDCQ